MTEKTSRAQELMGDVAPKLAELTDDVLFGDVWARPGLSPRDRSLITVAALVALDRPEQLRSHMGLGLDHGLTPEELVETVTQLAFYAGWPCGVGAVSVLRDVLHARGLDTTGLDTTGPDTTGRDAGGQQ